jgi:hypothetical protein
MIGPGSESNLSDPEAATNPRELIDIPVLPAADVFPMLDDDEMADLVADIKAYGLLRPIVLDAAGVLIDGRNRYAACKLAGVAPSFTTLAEGTDRLEYNLAANVMRRHMSKGQRAMVTALVIGTAEGKRDGQTKALSSFSNLSRAYVTQALTIRRYAPDLAHCVLIGAERFDKAYEVAQARKRQEDEAQAEARRRTDHERAAMRRLRRFAPDLAELVPEPVSIEAALDILAQRQEKEREEREALARAVETIYGALDPGVSETPDERAARIVAMLDASALPTRPLFSAARFARCTETLAAITRLLEAQETTR